jgi:thiol:disulfide interchange protein
MVNVLRILSGLLSPVCIYSFYYFLGHPIFLLEVFLPTTSVIGALFFALYAASGTITFGKKKPE